MLIVFAPNVLPAQDPSIVAPGAKLERLFDEGFFTEGPTQAPDGSVYFSDITVGKASGNQAGHIWRWDPRTRTTAVFRSPSGMSHGMVFDGQGRLIVADAGKPNGIAVSPDQATLYVAAHDNGSLGDLPPEMQAAPGRKALLAYDLAPDGSAKFRRAVVDFSPAGPDGIGVDRDGNIYCAVQGERQGIYVYSPAGKELAYIPTPESPTNVELGRGGAGPRP